MRGLLVGRFQPFHRGHLELVQHIRKAHPDDGIIFGIGSSEESFTPANPFTAAERAEMIDRALREARVANWISVPIPDLERHALWVAHVREIVPPFARVYTNNPLTRLLFERDHFEVESTPLFSRETLEGKRIRAAVLEDLAWRPRVPDSVARYFDEIDGTARVRLLGPE